MGEFKVSYDASGFVDLAKELPEIILEMRYYTSFNFTGKRVPGYESPCALLTKEAALVLQKIAADVAKDGYRVRIYDAYRPRRAVEHFVKWCHDPAADESMKPWFFPDVDRSELIPRDYISDDSSHTRGSTMDMTLFSMKTGHNLDMGALFDLFSTNAPPRATRKASRRTRSATAGIFSNS